MAVLEDLKVLLGKNKPHQSNRSEEYVKEPLKKLLIVEDDPILQEMYKDKFTHEGFQIYTADNGTIGLEKVTAHKPNIILLDLMVPVMDGKTMLRRLREIPEFKSVPVIVLTNAGGAENIRETLHYDNASEFLIKSNITIDDVVKKVQFWL